MKIEVIEIDGLEYVKEPCPMCKDGYILAPEFHWNATVFCEKCGQCFLSRCIDDHEVYLSEWCIT